MFVFVAFVNLDTIQFSSGSNGSNKRAYCLSLLLPFAGPEENQSAFRKHFDHELELYKNVVSRYRLKHMRASSTVC